MTKILYFIFALVAGLTVGLLLSIFIAISVFFQSFLTFPIAVYSRSVSSYESGLREISKEPKDIWERHIARMEEKKQQYKDHEEA